MRVSRNGQCALWRAGLAGAGNGAFQDGAQTLSVRGCATGIAHRDCWIAGTGFAGSMARD